MVTDTNTQVTNGIEKLSTNFIIRPNYVDTEKIEVISPQGSALHSEPIGLITNQQFATLIQTNQNFRNIQIPDDIHFFEVDSEAVLHDTVDAVYICESDKELIAFPLYDINNAFIKGPYDRNCERILSRYEKYVLDDIKDEPSSDIPELSDEKNSKNEIIKVVFHLFEESEINRRFRTLGKRMTGITEVWYRTPTDKIAYCSCFCVYNNMKNYLIRDNGISFYYKTDSKDYFNIVTAGVPKEKNKGKVSIGILIRRDNTALHKIRLIEVPREIELEFKYL